MTTHKALTALEEVMNGTEHTATSEVYEGSGYIKINVVNAKGKQGCIRMRTDPHGATIEANINGGGWQRLARVPNE